jgi:hypothetical protein
VMREAENSDVSGSHGDENLDGCLLGRCAMQSGRNLPTFPRSLLPPKQCPGVGGSKLL